MASGEQMPLTRVERNINAIEAQVREMRHALSRYKSDPRKYEPQLENLAHAANNVITSSRVILRALGED